MLHNYKVTHRSSYNIIMHTMIHATGQYLEFYSYIVKGVATIEATEAAASVISSANYILKYATTLTMQRASLFAD